MNKSQTIRFYSFLIVSALVCVFSMPVFADPFNSNLSKDERAKLNRGEVLIKNIGSLKNLSVNSTPQTKRMIEVMQDLKPAYVAEIIQIRPYKGNENLADLTE